jgi:hypothetical protein
MCCASSSPAPEPAARARAPFSYLAPPAAPWESRGRGGPHDGAQQWVRKRPRAHPRTRSVAHAQARGARCASGRPRAASAAPQEAPEPRGAPRQAVSAGGGECLDQERQAPPLRVADRRWPEPWAARPGPGGRPGLRTRTWRQAATRPITKAMPSRTARAANERCPLSHRRLKRLRLRRIAVFMVCLRVGRAKAHVARAVGASGRSGGEQAPGHGTTTSRRRAAVSRRPSRARRRHFSAASVTIVTLGGPSRSTRPDRSSGCRFADGPTQAGTPAAGGRAHTRISGRRPVALR